LAFQGHSSRLQTVGVRLWHSAELPHNSLPRSSAVFRGSFIMIASLSSRLGSLARAVACPRLSAWCTSTDFSLGLGFQGCWVQRIEQDTQNLGGVSSLLHPPPCRALDLLLPPDWFEATDSGGESLPAQLLVEARPAALTAWSSLGIFTTPDWEVDWPSSSGR
jgi:hypothetical protein